MEFVDYCITAKILAPCDIPKDIYAPSVSKPGGTRLVIAHAVTYYNYYHILSLLVCMYNVL